MTNTWKQCRCYLFGGKPEPFQQIWCHNRCPNQPGNRMLQMFTPAMFTMMHRNIHTNTQKADRLLTEITQMNYATSLMYSLTHARHARTPRTHATHTRHAHTHARTHARTHTHIHTHTHTHTRLTAFCPGLSRWAGTKSGFFWSKRQWVAMASAGPYASLHLAPDR